MTTLKSLECSMFPVHIIQTPVYAKQENKACAKYSDPSQTHASVSPVVAFTSCLRSVLINDVFILRSKSSPACSSPTPATASSSASFVCPRRSMSSSMELRVISFTTSTLRFCPMRYARSWACLSLCGLKSWSKLPDKFQIPKNIHKIVINAQDDNTCRSQIDAHAACFG